jgi:hypothetical protein
MIRSMAAPLDATAQPASPVVTTSLMPGDRSIGPARRAQSWKST